MDNSFELLVHTSLTFDQGIKFTEILFNYCSKSYR